MISILLLFFLSSIANVPSETNLRNDYSLIVPGIGAERVLINDNVQRVVSLLGSPESVSRFDKTQELFKSVFEVESPKKIFFDRLYYYTQQKVIVLFQKGSVSGIIGLSSSRITTESVSLDKGVEYFIFNYGNNKLIVLSGGAKKKRDKIYLFSNLGLAIGDDGDDDSIDFYIVFGVY